MTSVAGQRQRPEVGKATAGLAESNAARLIDRVSQLRFYVPPDTK